MQLIVEQESIATNNNVEEKESDDKELKEVKEEHEQENDKVVDEVAVEMVERKRKNNCIDFNVIIKNVTCNSVTLQWRPLNAVDVYKIEKHHKYQGWQKAGCRTSKTEYTVGDLEDNFGYKLRIKALKLNNTQDQYIDFYLSDEIVVCTLSNLPSTVALYRAIKNDEKFLVKRLLRHHPCLVDYPSPNGYLPLANAIAYGNKTIIDFLLTNGANVHIGNLDNKRTPLHQAFYYGCLPVARILLNKGADMEAQDIYGLTACHLAVDTNQSEILKFALQNGANIEATDACGWTLLMHAVIVNANLNILKLLIMHGACVMAQDTYGLTCTDLAKLYNNTMALEYLDNLKINK